MRSDVRCTRHGGYWRARREKVQVLLIFLPLSQLSTLQYTGPSVPEEKKKKKSKLSYLFTTAFILT